VVDPPKPWLELLAVGEGEAAAVGPLVGLPNGDSCDGAFDAVGELPGCVALPFAVGGDGLPCGGGALPGLPPLLLGLGAVVARLGRVLPCPPPDGFGGEAPGPGAAAPPKEGVPKRVGAAEGLDPPLGCPGAAVTGFDAGGCGGGAAVLVGEADGEGPARGGADAVGKSGAGGNAVGEGGESDGGGVGAVTGPVGAGWGGTAAPVAAGGLLVLGLSSVGRGKGTMGWETCRI
jgi:hypothetical protein